MKASDITDDQILTIIDKNEHEERRWTFSWDFLTAMPSIPAKVITAKLRSMKRRGIIDGCPCGCRGDWERV